MTGPPTVSVIIPTYNRMRMLKRALGSVLRQTYGSVEIIVVDGGSTDGTHDVVENLQGSYDINYIRNDSPQGLSAARNIAMRAATGQFIAFLDDDDMWEMSKVERQVKALLGAKDTYAGVYTGRRTITNDGQHRDTRRPTLEGDLHKQILVENVIGTPSSVLIKTSVALEIGGFSEDLSHHEDWDFFQKVSGKYYWICIPDPLVIRTAHANAMSRDTVNKKMARERILKTNNSQLKEHGLKSKAWHSHYQNAGLDFCRNRQFRDARKMFLNGLNEVFDPITALLFFATIFGPSGYEFLIWVKNMAKIRCRRGR